MLFYNLLSQGPGHTGDCVIETRARIDKVLCCVIVALVNCSRKSLYLVIPLSHSGCCNFVSQFPSSLATGEGEKGVLKKKIQA